MSSRILQTIRDISSTMSVDSTVYETCPMCGGEKKLGVTKLIDGVIYQCFRASCRLRGKYTHPMGKDAIAQILNKKAKEASTSVFRLPDYLVDGFESETGIKMAIKYDLMDAYIDKKYTTAYDPKLNRQVFFYRDIKENIVGAMGRALTSSVTPKAYIYPNSIKTPWVIRNSLTAVVVEDIMSAIKCYNVGYTGIALSGTKLVLDHLDFFNGYDTIIIALDKDAQIKSLELKKILDFYCSNVHIVLLNKDLKDSTRDEAKSVLES